MNQPKRVQISANEGNILLAMSAFQSGQCASPYAAAKAYNVNHKTLYRKVDGCTSRENYIPQNRKLSLMEDEVIVQNILKLHAQGLSSVISTVKEMADSICKAREDTPVGVNWPNTFMKRTPRL